MAEAIGVAASIIAVVGLAGQVIQGCQNIKAWVGNYNSAPKDVQDLIQELNSIEESRKVTDMIRATIDRQEIDIQLAPALQQCLDVVRVLRRYIVDADMVFRESAHSKRSRGWHRLKIMLGKEVITGFVGKLSRAKVQLVLVQSNVLLYTSLLI